MSILTQIQNFFKKEKFETLHSKTLEWWSGDKKNIVWRTTVLLELGDRGTRRVRYVNKNSPINMDNCDYFHEVITPYLNKIGKFNISDDDLRVGFGKAKSPKQNRNKIDNKNVVQFPKG